MAIIYCQVHDVGDRTREPQHVGIFVSHPSGPPAVGTLVRVAPTCRSDMKTATWRVVDHYWVIDNPSEAATKLRLLVTHAPDPFTVEGRSS